MKEVKTIVIQLVFSDIFIQLTMHIYNSFGLQLLKVLREGEIILVNIFF